MKEKTKVISYIFRKNASEILVFDHVNIPEAGTQVIGGTVEANEDLKQALSREIFEESGLQISCEELIKIGETTYRRSDLPEINYRHYYRLDTHGLPERWIHKVKSDGDDNGMDFLFFWLEISLAKSRLVGNFGELLP